MKKTLLAMTLGVLAAGNAAAETFDFSYIDSSVEALGLSAAETYDVAICLPGALFDGFRIKSISAEVNATGGVTPYATPSLWLSSDLKDVSGKYTPDIASYEAELASDGIMTVTLPEAYEISSADVYVGYSVTVRTLNAATNYPMVCGKTDDPNAFFCRTNRTMPQWSNLATDMQYGAAISVVLESDDVASRSVTLYSLPDPIYMKVGEPWSGTFTFASFGMDPVNSIDVEYSVEGTDYTRHFDLSESVPGGLNNKFSVDFPIDAIDHKMRENVEFKVTKVNGEPNESKMASASSYLGVLTEVPVHQTLIEEYTGTWCGWCTRGYAALEYIRANEPDFVVAAYHNGDPMQVTTNYPAASGNFPYMSFDRAYGGDPYYGSERFGGTVPVVEEVKYLNSLATPWGIKVSHTWEDENTLTATADVWNVLGYDEGKYTIAYILVADGLSGTSSTWYQSNNYYSVAQSPDFIPELNEFCSKGEYGKRMVKGLVFNDVVVSTTGIYGVAGSIPASMEAEQTVSHSISFDLSQISSKLIPDRNKLRVIAAVLDRNGIALNCAKNEVNDYDEFVNAVEGVEVDANAPVEYYDLNGVKVAEPTRGIYIRRQGAKAEKLIIR